MAGQSVLSVIVDGEEFLHPHQLFAETDFLARAADWESKNNFVISDLPGSKEVYGLFIASQKFHELQSDFPLERVAASWLAADYLQAPNFKEKIVKYMETRVWKARGGVSAPWKTFLEEILDPLSSAEHVSSVQVTSFLAQFSEKIGKAAARSLDPGVTVGAKRRRRSAATLEDSPLVKLLHDLSARPDDGLRSALLDCLTQSEQIDLEKMFKGTVANFGKAIPEQDLPMLQAAGRILVQKLVELARARELAEAEYLSRLLECALACGCPEDGDPAAWLEEALGARLKELGMEALKRLPLRSVKRIVASCARAGVQPQEVVAQVDTYVSETEGIDVPVFTEFCKDIDHGMGGTDSHDKRLRKALSMLALGLIQVSAIEAFMKCVDFERVSGGCLFEATQSADAERILGKEELWRVTLYLDEKRRRSKEKTVAAEKLLSEEQQALAASRQHLSTLTVHSSPFAEGHVFALLATEGQKASLFGGTDDGRVLVWDRRDPREKTRHLQGVRGGDVTALAATRDALYSGDSQGNVCAWTCVEGRPPTPFSQILGGIQPRFCVGMTAQKGGVASLAATPLQADEGGDLVACCDTEGFL